MSKNILLKVDNVSLKINQNRILENINFHIDEGEYVALIGPNGSGKTSLLKVILGLYTQTSGDVQINVPNIGYVPQKLDIDKSIPISVKEFLKVYNPKFGNKESDFYALEKLDASKLLDRKIGLLSGGELQKILIVNATLNKPKLLLLDEPTAGIDLLGEKKFYEFTREYILENNASIVLVSHDIHMVFEYATSILCINITMQCNGKPEDIRECNVIKDMFSSATHFHHAHH